MVRKHIATFQDTRMYHINCVNSPVTLLRWAMETFSLVSEKKLRTQWVFRQEKLDDWNESENFSWEKDKS